LTAEGRCGAAAGQAAVSFQEEERAVSPLTISCIAFACILGGALLGMLLGRLLPAHHLSGESRESVRMGSTMMATLTALVIGLLVASTKGTYDAQNSAVKELAAKVLLLDRALALYGKQSEAAEKETKDARETLRRAVARMTEQIWPDDKARSDLGPGEARVEFEQFYNKVAALKPENDAQRALKARALDITADLGQARLRMYAQRDSSVPTAFLAVLVVWLVVLFAGYGLLAPRNLTVLAVLFVCVLSVSGALFLILELDRPFDGVLRLSSAPLRDALSRVGQ
jgi:hypothetical protein